MKCLPNAGSNGPVRLDRHVVRPGDARCLCGKIDPIGMAVYTDNQTGDLILMLVAEEQ